MKIKKIKAEETWTIRQEVMWPDMPIDFVKLDGDYEGLHLGLFLHDQLISVVSLFFMGRTAQFRKFATVHKYQGRGYGSALLQNVFSRVEKMGIERVWCNARVAKVVFYSKFGMKKTDQYFYKNGIEYVIMERKILDPI